MRAMKSRWIPASIPVLAGASLLWVWSIHDADDQMRVLLTIAIAVLTGLLLLLWLVVLSGLSRRARLGTFAGAIATAGLLGGLLRIDGVSGNFVPILRWRLSPKADTTLSREALERPRPAELMVDNGTATLIRTAEAPSDLLTRDVCQDVALRS